jgi:hypothetical protein
MIMIEKFTNPKFLRIFLYLVAVHSFIVGVNLIFFPPEWMIKFGFNPITENFFKVQGGVFHLVMVVAYIMAGLNPVECKKLILFAIITKFIATVFLFTYFLLYTEMITVFLSGVSDFIMGIIILYLYKKADLTKNSEA